MTTDREFQELWRKTRDITIYLFKVVYNGYAWESVEEALQGLQSEFPNCGITAIEIRDDSMTVFANGKPCLLWEPMKSENQFLREKWRSFVEQVGTGNGVDSP